ncbi:MAG TPA: hypothetical protein VE503_09335, partial [Ornithinibacter sp.]|nr:hypothetical protein [Ornithinibacter sp.]
MSRARAGVRRILGAPFRPLLALPVMRRVAFHGRRVTEGLDVHFFRTLAIALVAIVAVAALVVTLVEQEKRSFSGLLDSA